MTNVKQTLLSILYILTISLSPFAFSEESIFHNMTTEEKKITGIEKLSEEEISQLEQWINTKTTSPLLSTTNPIADSNNNKTTNISRKEAEAILNAPIDTQIAGEFNGWRGKTIFRLSNGEIWKQRLPGVYVEKLDSPQIRIKKNFLGFYEMEIVETGKKIGVTRLK